MREAASGGELRVSAPAKINLYLHVLGRRPAGYHELDSLVVFADIGDTVTARRADGLTLALEGPFAEALCGAADNLVLRAARLLADRAGVAPRAALSLRKNLPVASGIGGGSSDAAATLRALTRLWRLSLDEAELAAIAGALGADVPVCLYRRSAWLGGIGERLAKLLEKETGFETRAVVLGHIQRGGSPTAFDRVLSTRFGVAAADLVHEGKFGRMVALSGGKIVDVPIEAGVGQLKTLDPDFYKLAGVFFD